MPVVSIFSGVFCLGREVAEAVAAELSCPLLGDAALLSQVSRQFDVPEAKLAKAMFDKPSVFNQFSHERERALAWLKVGMANILAQEDLVYLGYGAHLIPKSVSHVLSVCLIADLRSRLNRAKDSEGLSEKEAGARIHREDHTAQRWVETLTGGEVWSGKLYDILLPMDKQDQAQAARLIAGHARAVALTPTSESRQAVADFVLAAQVEAALAAQGHNTRDLSLCVNRGRVEIKVNKKVLMLARLEEDLKRLAGQVAGVAGVGVEPGPGYYQADVYRRADF
jgi:cytidylate kinase